MQITLTNVRLAFPTLYEPKTFPGADKARYSAVLIVEPGSDNDKIIRAAIQAVAEEKWGKKAPAMLKGFEGNSNKFCYLDGDTKDYDGFQGKWFISAHRQERDGPPKVVDRAKNPVGPNDGTVYAGCYVWASLDIYAQEGQYAGIRAGLRGIRFYKDGDAFAGGSPVTDDELGEDLEAEDEESLV